MGSSGLARPLVGLRVQYVTALVRALLLLSQIMCIPHCSPPILYVYLYLTVYPRLIHYTLLLSFERVGCVNETGLSNTEVNVFFSLPFATPMFHVLYLTVLKS